MIISLSALTHQHIDQIFRYWETKDQVKMVEDKDWFADGAGWFLMINEHHFLGYTPMSDFKMRVLLERIGVNMNEVTFEREFHEDEWWTHELAPDYIGKAVEPYLGEYVAVIRDEVIAHAKTYSSLVTLLEAWKSREKYDENWLSYHIFYVDPEYYDPKRYVNEETHNEGELTDERTIAYKMSLEKLKKDSDALEILYKSGFRFPPPKDTPPGDA